MASELTFEIMQKDVLVALRAMPRVPTFDLVISSPPYNIGKVYETREPLEDYRKWQAEVFDEILARLKPGGHFCWQVGTFVDNGGILPLDYLFIPLMNEKGLVLRNRFIWHFEHGLHAKTRFSGRHETVLWATRAGDDFAYDPNVILPYGAPKPAGFEDLPTAIREALETDVWDIPNVKHNHPEKIEAAGHPCQMPVAIGERLVLGLTKPGDLIFDPFAGLASTGVAALVHGRSFLGIERDEGFAAAARARLDDALAGTVRWRPHDQPVIRPKPEKLDLSWADTLDQGLIGTICAGLEHVYTGNRGWSDDQAAAAREIVESARAAGSAPAWLEDIPTGQRSVVILGLHLAASGADPNFDLIGVDLLRTTARLLSPLRDRAAPEPLTP